MRSLLTRCHQSLSTCFSTFDLPFLMPFHQTCGVLNKWKRVKDQGNLQKFGFAEYADPEGVLRALRVIGGEGPLEAPMFSALDGSNVTKKLIVSMWFEGWHSETNRLKVIFRDRTILFTRLLSHISLHSDQVKADDATRTYLNQHEESRPKTVVLSKYFT